jgi:hypothetical protein
LNSSAEKFKTNREDRKLRLKIQIFSGTFGVPPEIRNRSGKTKFAAANLQHPQKIQIADWRANASGEA